MKGFSFGIFIVIFIILSILSICLSGGYFYLDGKRVIEDAAANTPRYSLPLADAYSDIAENCYYKNDYSKLKILFGSNILKKNVEEAFFVLADGGIIAHSDSGAAEKLKGNLSNDKKAYNIEQILLPLKSKSADAQFINYNIHNKKIPFSMDYLKILSKYFKNKLEFNGWLVSKAVIIKDNGIGCVCLIIGKDRLYKSIEQIFKDAVYLLFVLFSICFLTAFTTAMLVYTRYRNMTAGLISADFSSSGGNTAVKDAVRIADPAMSTEQIKISSWDMNIPAAENDDKDSNYDTSKIIKDAIPVSGQ